MVKEVVFTPSQAIIADDLHRFRVVNCGRRFGKTTLAVWEMFAQAMYRQDGRICYIAPTYQQARDIAWQELKRACESAKPIINESRLEITLKNTKGGTSQISLRGWESIDTLRGQKYDYIVVDEIASMKNWDTNWEEIIRPTLTDTKGEALFISTPKGFNHFYDLYNKQEKDKDYKSFHFTSFDNPHLPLEELEKAKTEMTEDRFAQEYLADFRKTEGLVYKEFDRKKHVYTDKDGSNYVPFVAIHRAVGVDWGYVNPTAVIPIDVDTDSRYFISSEYYKTGKTTDEIVEIAKSYRGNYYYPDPAEPDRNEMLKKAGLNVREVSKDIEAGIQVVRELFKSGRLFIHSSCVNIIRELETYSYPKKKPDKNEYENPIKEDDHTMDAIRYVLYMHSRQKTGKAYVHYAGSAMPVKTTPSAKKPAYTHYQRL